MFPHSTCLLWNSKKKNNKLENNWIIIQPNLGSEPYTSSSSALSEEINSNLDVFKVSQQYVFAKMCVFRFNE
jgi:hypothetical protein